MAPGGSLQTVNTKYKVFVKAMKRAQIRRSAPGNNKSVSGVFLFVSLPFIRLCCFNCSQKTTLE